MADEIKDTPENTPTAQELPAARASLHPALTIILVAMILWFGFQSVQLVQERGHLSLVKINQDSAVLESEKIRTQFQTIMEKTSELANRGHGGARMVMDELQKRGFAIAPKSNSVDKSE